MCDAAVRALDSNAFQLVSRSRYFRSVLLGTATWLAGHRKLARSDIRNEHERAALRQQYAATRAMYTRWQQDLLAAVPTARIVELPGANLFMFLSNEADVLREIRAFADTLTGR